MRPATDAAMQGYEATARDVLATLGSMDSERLRAYLAEEVVLELPFAPAGLGARKVVGLDNVVATMARAPAVYSSLQFTVTDSYPVPSRHTVILRVNSLGQLKVGGEYSNQYLQLFTFQERKVVHWMEFFDALQVVTMLEALSAAGG
jgi:ketosteroid isomerase-like protein